MRLLETTKIRKPYQTNMQIILQWHFSPSERSLAKKRKTQKNSTAVTLIAQSTHCWEGQLKQRLLFLKPTASAWVKYYRDRPAIKDRWCLCEAPSNTVRRSVVDPLLKCRFILHKPVSGHYEYHKRCQATAHWKHTKFTGRTRSKWSYQGHLFHIRLGCLETRLHGCF